MFDLLTVQGWQAHHVMLFSLGNVRFDLHFLVWIGALLFFMVWCGAKTRSEAKQAASVLSLLDLRKIRTIHRNERIVAGFLIFMQFVILGAAASLDYLDYVLAGSGQGFEQFLRDIASDEERSLGVRPDALMFGMVEFLTMFILIKVCRRPRKMVDPISLWYVALILLHLIVATTNFDTVGFLIAYDVLWLSLYYVIIATLFLTSHRAQRVLGDLRIFTFAHFLYSGLRSSSLSK